MGELKETFSLSQKHQDTKEILGYVRDDPRLDQSHAVLPQQSIADFFGNLS